MKVPLLYKDQPMFGFDISSHQVKVMQLKPESGHRFQVVGYGFAEFPADTIVEGIIVDPDPITQAVRPLLKQITYGKITARRVAIALPVAKVFTRVLQLPPMNDADTGQAVRFEAEQYIPVPLPDLYIDYNVFKTSPQLAPKTDHPDNTDPALPAANSVLMVAAPRAIVDSYIKLISELGLEVGVVESSLSAATRALTVANKVDNVAIVVDIGSQAIDIAVYDQVLRLTNTIAMGGDDLTNAIAKALNLSPKEAADIKFKFGLGPSGLHDQIAEALDPKLKKLVEEVRRVIRFYGEREQNSKPIQTLVLTGGTSAMPGITEYLQHELAMQVVPGNAWSNLDTRHIQAVSAHEAGMYTTAIGLAALGAHG